MGAAISSTEKLSDNHLVQHWTGLQPITDNDPFWNQFLSFNFKPPTNRVDAKFLEETLQDSLRALQFNSTTTGNFAAFIRVILRRASELKSSTQCEDKIFLWQFHNAMLILRYACKYFAQHLKDEEFQSMFCKSILLVDGKVKTESDSEQLYESPAEELLNALVEICVDVPISELTYELHLECFNCLLVLLSSQLFQEKPLHNSSWMRLLISGKCAIHVPLLTKSLVNVYLDGHEAKLETGGDFDGGGSIVFGLAASMLNVLKWGTSDGEGDSGDSTGSIVPTPARQSLLFLLAIVSYCSGPFEKNPYRASLFACTNSQEKSSVGNPSHVATFKVDYGKLYKCLSASAQDEAALLLLYFLLHKNLAFRNYVLSRVNIDVLILPILRVLYADATKGSASHHIYLALVIILILTEDDFFCKVIHETMLKNVDWYSERSFTEISLGGLIILVLAKTIQVNIVKVRDRYLHTNCLAALGNMSAHFKHLNSYVAQRLITLLELLSKRQAKAIEHLRLSVEYDLNSQEHKKEGLETMNEELSALEQGIRMLLDIINSAISHSLHQNPHLVYTILYNRQLFANFAHHPNFQDLLQNIEIVLNHFSSRIKTLGKDATVAEILDAIKTGSMQWSANKLKKFPELKFKYVEDENTEEFFVPYSWTLIFQNSGLFWDPGNVKLFNAVTLVNSARK